MQGGDHEWRIRIGDYRVVYTIDDAKLLVEVTRVRHREWSVRAMMAFHGFDRCISGQPQKRPLIMPVIVEI